MPFELLTGPPNSGKRKYLSDKISESIKKKNEPEKLLVLTNTVSSADYFNKKIRKELNSYSCIWSESISSFCKKILREYYFWTELKPGFKVISDFEKRLLIRNIFKRGLRLKFFKPVKSREGLIREISNFIDTAKRNPDWEKHIKKTPKYEDLYLIMKLYQQTLIKFNYIDFVDLTIYGKKLLDNKNILNFKALYVYEAEDMDIITAELLMAILRTVDEAVISISPESCIYPFRGARPEDIKNILINNFKFSETVFTVKKNNRNELFIESASQDEEAEYIALSIARRIKNGVHPKDIAIVSRSIGEDISIFTDALKRKGVNYIIVGGVGFFKNPVIIQFISLLKCIRQKESTEDTHLYRTLKILNILSEDELDGLRQLAVLYGSPLASVFNEKMEKESIKFWEIINKFSKNGQKDSIAKFIYRLMEKTGILKKMSKDKTLAEIYGYFYRIISDFSRHYLKFHKSKLYFEEFMDNLFDIMSGFGKELDIAIIPDTEEVKIMTVHQIKGKIFKTVYLIDMNEDNFPRSFSENPLLTSSEYKKLGIKPVPDVSEQHSFEKKLFEIARTRAESEIIYCWYNTASDGSHQAVSSFIKDKKLKSLLRDISNTVIDEKDVYIKLIEMKINNFHNILPPNLREKLKSINEIIKFDKNELTDVVKTNLPEVFSYTIIKNFIKCPEYFFLTNVLKLKNPQTIYANIGIAVHGILQKLYSDSEGIEHIESIIKEECRKMKTGSRFERRNSYRIIYDIIFKYLPVFEAEKVKVISTEENFECNFKGIKLRGRFDRVDRDGMSAPNGKNLIVVDYKTAKKVSGERGLLGALARGEDFQIPIYYWASNCDFFCVVRLRESADKMKVLIDFKSKKVLDAINKAEEMFQDVVGNIKKGIFTKEPKACRECYFSRICDI